MGEAAGVEVAGVDDGSAGLELVAGDADGGEVAAHPGTALEDADLTPGEGGGETGGVVGEEEGGGGAGDVGWGMCWKRVEPKLRELGWVGLGCSCLWVGLGWVGLGFWR